MFAAAAAAARKAPAFVARPLPCREVRRIRIAKSTSDAPDQVVGTLKRAADALRHSHPYRVHDLDSAKRVHGCGPWMAQVGQDQAQPPGQMQPPSLPPWV